MTLEEKWHKKIITFICRKEKQAPAMSLDTFFLSSNTLLYVNPNLFLTRTHKTRCIRATIMLANNINLLIEPLETVSLTSNRKTTKIIPANLNRMVNQITYPYLLYDSSIRIFPTADNYAIVSYTFSCPHKIPTILLFHHFEVTYHWQLLY